MVSPEKSILVVEDHSFIRRLMVQIISEVNPKVITASDGQEALGVLASRGAFIQAVVTDIAMPYRSGLEVLKAIRTNKTAAHWTMPTAIISGFSEIATIEQSIALEVDVFLVKPITRGSIMGRINWMLSPAARHDRALAFKGREPEDFEEIEVDTQKMRIPDPNKEPTAGAVRKIKGFRYAIDQLQPGMMLADRVYGSSGQLLIGDGVLLTNRHITRLKDMVRLGGSEIDYVWVDISRKPRVSPGDGPAEDKADTGAKEG